MILRSTVPGRAAFEGACHTPVRRPLTIGLVALFLSTCALILGAAATGPAWAVAAAASDTDLGAAVTGAAGAAEATATHAAPGGASPLAAAVVAITPGGRSSRLAAPTAATPGGPIASAAASVGARAETVLTVTGADGAAVALTMAELQTLPAFAGSAGYLDVIGRPFGPHRIRGVRLNDLVALVAHDVSSPLSVGSLHPELPTPDDYQIALTAEQVLGRDVTVYSTQAPYAKTTMAAGDALVAVVAYEEDGAPIPAGPSDGAGPLRFWFAYERASGPGYLVDAALCVRWTNRIVVRRGAPDWTLKLRRPGTAARPGAVVRLSGQDFAELCARVGRSIKVDGHSYQGVPLHRLVGRVDDGRAGFNARLADRGYTVELRSPGRRVTLSSRRIGPDDPVVLVAWKRDGRELMGSSAPLWLTGRLTAAKRLPGLTSITLRGLPR